MTKRLASDKKGANMVEYVILVGMVSLTTLAGAKTLGGRLLEKVAQQADAVSAINASAK